MAAPGTLVINISNQVQASGFVVITISGQTAAPIIQDQQVFKVSKVKLYIGNNLVDG
jgi:hypothetical protein